MSARCLLSQETSEGTWSLLVAGGLGTRRAHHVLGQRRGEACGSLVTMAPALLTGASGPDSDRKGGRVRAQFPQLQDALTVQF